MSHPLLHSFLNNIPLLTEQERLEIVTLLHIETFQKGTLLQKEGQIPQHCFFVLEGCVRQYQLTDGLEKTMEFFFFGAKTKPPSLLLLESSQG
ncbi:MAG: cyclic nucleotide-binding domain-containing protein [Aureispira sp.]